MTFSLPLACRCLLLGQTHQSKANPRPSIPTLMVPSCPHQPPQTPSHHIPSWPTPVPLAKSNHQLPTKVVNSNCHHYQVPIQGGPGLGEEQLRAGSQGRPAFERAECQICQTTPTPSCTNHVVLSSQKPQFRCRPPGMTLSDPPRKSISVFSRKSY